MGAAFFEGCLQTPPLHEIAHNFFSRLRLVGGKERFGRSLSCWVAREDPANGQGSGAKAIPPGGSRAQVHARLPSAYQSQVRRSHTVCGSCRMCSSEGSRAPTTRGRPRVCGSRAGAAWCSTESKRNGAIRVILWWVQWSPSSRML